MLSGGTPAEGRLSDVRQRQVGRGVAGRDCSFERIRKHLSRDRYGKGKGSRPVRAQARCRTTGSNPVSGRKPLGSRFAMVRGAFTSRLDATPPQSPSGMRVALPPFEMTAVEDRSGSMDRQDSSEDGTREESPKREQSNV